MRNPVLLMMSLFAGANAVLALGLLQDLIPPSRFAWIVLALTGLQAGVQFWVRSEVTPVDDPRDRDGAPLIRSGGSDTSRG